MSNKFSKILKLAAVMLVTASSVFGARYDRRNKGEMQADAPMQQGHMMQEGQMMGGYSAPARYDVRTAWDFFFTGDFLYWQARMGGLNYGIVTEASTLSSNLPPSKGKVLNPSFGWHPGVRLGLGINFEYDNWDLMLEWAHLANHNNTTYKVADTTKRIILPTRIFPHMNLNATEASQSWRCIFNTMDLHLGRPYYLGKSLTCRPHGGVRAAWVRQSEHRFYKDIKQNTTDKGSLRNKTILNSWALGPRFGMETNWMLGEGFRFFGNSAGSLQYTKFRSIKKDTNPEKLIISGQDLVGSVKDNKSNGQVQPNLDASLGLGWGSYFDNSNWHVDLSLCYEFSYYPNYNTDMIFLDDSTPSMYVSNRGDLAFHGGTFKFRFDF